MIRNFILLFLLTHLALGSKGQASNTPVPESYLRNSVTVVFADFSGGNHWSTARSKIEDISFSDKYDNNNLSSLILQPSFSRGTTLNVPIANALLGDIEKADMARKIISKWYNRQEDGAMDMELVHQRGRFTATDADFMVASSTARGDAALKDLGNRLVNKSYILLIDLNSIKTQAEAGAESLKGWDADVTAYLYRIDFNDEVKNAFYETWIYDDDLPEDKYRKREAFKKINFPITYITTVTASVSASQSKQYGSKSEDQLMADLVQKAYDEALFNLEMKVDEFKVVTPLYGRRPLRAKIGLKEGLRTDYRFFVYEHVYNSRTQKAEPVRRGVIRVSSASNIHDNRHEAFGDMGTSKFYQVSGRRLHEGYTLVQRNDFGLELILGAELGEVGGGYARLDVRTGRFTGMKAFFIYLEGGVDAADGNTLPLGSYGTQEFSMLRVGGGLAKGFHLTRNSEFRPYLGIGVEGASNDTYTDDLAFQAYYLKFGANLALNLTHNFQLIGGAGSYSFISDVENVAESIPEDVAWTDIFENRQGVSILVGIKFMF